MNAHGNRAMVKKYGGVVIPMVTPVTSQGTVDLAAARKITEHLVGQGGSPFVLGTTGEAPSVPLAEQVVLVEAVVKQTRKRSPVYAGIIGLAFGDIVTRSRRYFEMGVDVVVVPLPSYYPLQEKQMLKFYLDLADALAGPLMTYNIPATTHHSIPLPLLERLSTHPRIVGHKDSEKSVERLTQSVKLWRTRPDFSFFCGCGVLLEDALKMGADGIIPSTGNLVPQLFLQMMSAAQNQEWDVLAQLQQRNMAISHVYQNGRDLSTSLAALKVVMKTMGLCEEHVLPPLCTLDAETKQEVLAGLQQVAAELTPKVLVT